MLCLAAAFCATPALVWSDPPPSSVVVEAATQGDSVAVTLSNEGSVDKQVRLTVEATVDGAPSRVTSEVSVAAGSAHDVVLQFQGSVDDASVVGISESADPIG